MQGNRHFFHSVFKRLQTFCAPTTGHYKDESDMTEFAGGFSLRYVGPPRGMLGTLGPGAAGFGMLYKIQPGWQPLNPASTDPQLNPLYKMLEAALLAAPPDSITVNGQEWPPMPPASLSQPWKDINSPTPKLLAAFGAWISGGKNDDSPRTPLSYPELAASPPPPWPQLPKPGFDENVALLFVSSFPGDDGRRYGDHEKTQVAYDYVPWNFWETSQIFLTDDDGVVIDPPTLESGKEYNVAARIGNAGNWHAGRSGGDEIIQVICDAFAFNTNLSPSTRLPSLSNLDPASTAGTYEQYYLARQSSDVVGFRFNVDKVASALRNAIAADPSFDTGGLSPGAWMKGSHACLKVRIIKGETDNPYKPLGFTPLTLASNPHLDRHIAQRNLGKFVIKKTAGTKKPPMQWMNFIAAQAGKGANELVLKHDLPADAFQPYLAITRRAYERYVGPKNKGGGSHRGYRVVGKPPSKPFPNAVILRPTAKAARLVVAEHAKERFLGFSLGLDCDPARIKTTRLGDMAMVHAGPDGKAVGGFTMKMALRK